MDLENHVSNSIIWKSDTQQYPACRILDLKDNFDLNASPLQVYFSAKENPNLELTIFVEQVNRVMKRPQKILQFDYVGPTIYNSLNTPKSLSFLMKFSQIKYLEEAPQHRCLDYPTEQFENYGDCDEKNIYERFKNQFKIMPFWVARSSEEVTDLRWKCRTDDIFILLILH